MVSGLVRMGRLMFGAPLYAAIQVIGRAREMERELQKLDEQFVKFRRYRSRDRAGAR